MAIGQTATAYTTTGGVCMIDNKKIEDNIEVVHTIPKMTEAERTTTEKRVSSDLFEVLSGIYTKLKLESE